MNYSKIQKECCLTQRLMLGSLRIDVIHDKKQTEQSCDYLASDKTASFKHYSLHYLFENITSLAINHNVCDATSLMCRYILQTLLQMQPNSLHFVRSYVTPAHRQKKQNRINYSDFYIQF